VQREEAHTAPRQEPNADCSGDFRELRFQRRTSARLNDTITHIRVTRKYAYNEYGGENADSSQAEELIVWTQAENARRSESLFAPYSPKFQLYLAASEPPWEGW